MIATLDQEVSSLRKKPSNYESLMEVATEMAVALTMFQIIFPMMKGVSSVAEEALCKFDELMAERD
jgi:hypothetical protein